MSFAVDANLFVYASNRDSPHHEASRAFLDERVRGREILRVAPPASTRSLRTTPRSTDRK